MTFDPKAHLIQLPRRVKDPATGQWVTRLDDYLEVKNRVIWFREKFPHGVITTESIMLDWEHGVAICQATVEDGEGGKASAMGTETRKSFEDFVEKAGTRAVGRALALLGFGTQFVGEELAEGEHVADAPVTSATGHAPAPEPTPADVHPTADEISMLVDSARAANISNDDFAHDMRRLLNLPAAQKITKKFLRETMTVSQYNAARAHYGEALRKILEEDVPDHAPPAVHSVADSSSAIASVDDPDAAAKTRPRAEVAGWALQVDQKEVEYVLSHYPAEKARALLWGSRRRTKEPQLTESAA